MFIIARLFDNVQLFSTFVLDAAINHGNSGGPVLDTSGRVIGVADWSAVDPQTGLPATGLNFAVSADAVTALLTRAIDPAQSHGPLPLPLMITRSVPLVYESDKASHSGFLHPIVQYNAACIALPPEALRLVRLRGQLHWDGRDLAVRAWLAFDGQPVPGSLIFRINPPPIFGPSSTAAETAKPLNPDAPLPKSVCVNYEASMPYLRDSFGVTYWLDYKVWSPAVVP